VLSLPAAASLCLLEPIHSRRGALHVPDSPWRRFPTCGAAGNRRGGSKGRRLETYATGAAGIRVKDERRLEHRLQHIHQRVMHHPVWVRSRRDQPLFGIANPELGIPAGVPPFRRQLLLQADQVPLQPLVERLHRRRAVLPTRDGPWRRFLTCGPAGNRRGNSKGRRLETYATGAERLGEGIPRPTRPRVAGKG